MTPLLLLLLAGCGDAVVVREYLAVIAVSPPDGSVDVPVDAGASVLFSAPLDPSTVSAESAYLEDEEGARPALDLSLEEDDQLLRLLPTEPLEAGTTYELVLTTAIASPELGALPAGLSSRFTTASAAGGGGRPEADAGPDLELAVGEEALLDGSGSSDPDGDPLVYRWALVSAPGGSQASLCGEDEVQARLVPDLPGDYLVSLVVSDGTLSSDPDYARIAAREGDTGAGGDTGGGR